MLHSGHTISCIGVLGMHLEATLRVDALKWHLSEGRMTFSWQWPTNSSHVLSCWTYQQQQNCMNYNILLEWLEKRVGVTVLYLLTSYLLTTSKWLEYITAQ